MKKLFYLLAAVTATLTMLASCEKDDVNKKAVYAKYDPVMDWGISVTELKAKMSSWTDWSENTMAGTNAQVCYTHKNGGIDICYEFEDGQLSYSDVTYFGCNDQFDRMKGDWAGALSLTWKERTIGGQTFYEAECEQRKCNIIAEATSANGQDYMYINFSRCSREASSFAQYDPVMDWDTGMSEVKEKMRSWSGWTLAAEDEQCAEYANEQGDMSLDYNFENGKLICSTLTYFGHNDQLERMKSDWASALDLKWTEISDDDYTYYLAECEQRKCEVIVDTDTETDPSSMSIAFSVPRSHEYVKYDPIMDWGISASELKAKMESWTGWYENIEEEDEGEIVYAKEKAETEIRYNFDSDGRLHKSAVHYDYCNESQFEQMKSDWASALGLTWTRKAYFDEVVYEAKSDMRSCEILTQTRPYTDRSYMYISFTETH